MTLLGRCLFATAACLWAIAPEAWGAAPSALPTRGGEEAMGQTLRLEADSISYDAQKRTYQVRGRVRIALADLTVRCESAILTAAPAQDQILKVVFSGQVEARRGPDSFRAQRITYHVRERRMFAEGSTRTQLRLPAGVPGVGLSL
ncbi:MAG: LptA/OstA family protein [Candidatus Sericytochromatia bacterium]|nr:LptA/OstA family protein [Candidatus Sericytochromatia bacterium]